jgi:hypothetical protein
MTPAEFAARITNREYRSELTKEESALAKVHGLVVVFGYSDDNVEFEGAIRDEIGAWDGTTVRVDAEGVIPDFEQVDKDNKAEMKEWFRRDGLRSFLIQAVWDAPDEPTWTFKTAIPHSTFDVMEDGEVFCRGIVFSLDELRAS